MKKQTKYQIVIGGILLCAVGVIVLIFVPDTDCRNLITQKNHTLIGEIKDKLRDPKSFQHIQSGRNSAGEVLMHFRAKNAFGGYVENAVRATYSSGCTTLIGIRWYSREIDWIEQHIADAERENRTADVLEHQAEKLEAIIKYRFAQ